MDFVNDGKNKMLWDINQLYQCPEVFEADSFDSDGVEPLYFKGLDFKGNPTRVFAWVGFPENCENKKVPGVVLVHGGGGTAYAEWVGIWNRRGYAAIAVATTGKKGIETEVPEQSRLLLHQWAGPTEEDKFENIEGPYEDHWAYHAVADVILAHSLLRSYRQVDSKKTGIAGVSWGGFLTCLASSIDKRFKCAAAAYGCGFIYIDSPTFTCDKDSEVGRRWIKLWDPSNYLAENDTPIFWFTGTNDPAYSLDILERSCNLIKGELTLRIEPGMNHSHRDAWKIAEQYAFVDSHLKGRRKLVKIHRPKLDGNNLCVKYDSSQPVKKTEMIFTCDGCEKWQDKKWDCQEIIIDKAGEVCTKLPENTLHVFVNITDQNGFTTSTPCL